MPFCYVVPISSSRHFRQHFAVDRRVAQEGAQCPHRGSGHLHEPPGQGSCVDSPSRQAAYRELHFLFRAEVERSTMSSIVVDSRDSGYSAIHFVLAATLQKRANREDVPDTVKFEIQIRDIFEEAWSQVSHAVSYGDKDRLYETGAALNVTVDIIARPQLNALKTVADGCGQLADQIRRTYDDLRGRLSIVDASKTYTSVVPLDDVCKFVLKDIPEGREVLIQTIKTAYGLLQDARDAGFDKNFDNRVAEGELSRGGAKVRRGDRSRRRYLWR